MTTILENYHQWRRKTLPPPVADIEWRHETLVKRMDSLEQLIAHRFPQQIATSESQAQILETLRLLRPQRVEGLNKIRVGAAGDGGYV